VAENGRGPLAACLLAWLMPGAGHLYLGRKGKGAAFFGALLTLFVLGVVMGSRLRFHAGFDDPLAFLFSLAQMSLAVPYGLARLLGYDLGDPTAPTFEYGCTFTAVAGLLNILVMLDAHDTATGRKK
jgi:hypothetical protein